METINIWHSCEYEDMQITVFSNISIHQLLLCRAVCQRWAQLIKAKFDDKIDVCKRELEKIDTMPHGLLNALGGRLKVYLLPKFNGEKLHLGNYRYAISHREGNETLIRFDFFESNGQNMLSEPIVRGTDKLERLFIAFKLTKVDAVGNKHARVETLFANNDRKWLGTSWVNPSCLFNQYYPEIEYDTYTKIKLLCNGGEIPSLTMAGGRKMRERGILKLWKPEDQ